jgi:hypothetical protein
MSSLVFELMVAAVVALAIIFVLLGIIFKR